MVKRSRRAVLAAAGVALGGCTSGDGDGGGEETTTHKTTTGEQTTTGAGTTNAVKTETQSGVTHPNRVPISTEQRYVGLDRDTLRRNVISGGPGKDGIPSIDDPQFVDAETAEETLGGASRVFGLVIDGDARAYPQRILVYHEIVNDVVGGRPVAVTYCPLTGTTLGFERGKTTFGVSGRLVNANLVMYDRATDSWWSQVPATSIRGELYEAFLREVPLQWTRWDRWKRAHPDTAVLSEDTGYVRPYGNDPYGREYYSSGPPLFEPVVGSDRFADKTTVIGARGRTGAICVRKAFLQTETIVDVSIDGDSAVAVYDAPLDTGYVYVNPEARDVRADGDRILVDGQVFDPHRLPLSRVHAFEAMWFAWYGFYPETEVYG